MGQWERNPIVPEDVDVKLKRAAHHEAGHIVVAAAQGLRLRPEGLSVDPSGEGLACYCKQPDGSDLLRERISVATFAGFYAERRFCEARSYPLPDAADWFRDSLDGREARKLISEMSVENLSERSVPVTQGKLQLQSQQLVEQHWPAIEALATALLARDWEPLRPLKSGGAWSKETTAKYVAGDEAVRILERYGLPAVCDADC